SAYCASKQTSCSPASPTSSTNHKNKAGAPVPARFATERPRLRYSTDCHNFVLPCRHPSFTSGRRTMNAVTSPRARLVDLLWQLKQAYDNGEDQSDVRFIHFNTLLNDDVYRTEIVSRAVQASNRKIRELGQKLRDLNRDGALLPTRSSGQPAGVPLIINPDIRDTLQQRSTPTSPSRRAWRPWLQAAIALLGLVTVALFGYNQRDILRVVLDGQQTVRGEISGQHTWSADRTWVLDGLVFVTPGSSLTLEPGTRVLGRPGSALIVTRGAQIYARGSADRPVVFSSAQPVGSRRAGDWGGVVLLGSAPVNLADARIEGVPD